MNNSFATQLKLAANELRQELGNGLSDKIEKRVLKNACNNAVKEVKAEMKSGGEVNSKNKKSSNPGQVPYKHLNKKFPQRSNFYHRTMKAYIKKLQASIGWLGVDNIIHLLDKGGSKQVTVKNKKLFVNPGRAKRKIKRDGQGRIEDKQYRAIYKRIHGRLPEGTERRPAKRTVHIAPRPLSKHIIKSLNNYKIADAIDRQIRSTKHWSKK